MKKLNENQFNELCEKVENFEKEINESNESMYEYYQEQWESGEYNYLLEPYNVNLEHVELEEELDDALKISSETLLSLITECIENDYIEARYDKMASPFYYGGYLTNEIYFTGSMGEVENQVDNYDNNYKEFKPSFKLSEYFKNKDSFEEFIRNEFNYTEYLDVFWAFFEDNSTHEFIMDNYDYDGVRFMIDYDKYKDEILEFLEVKDATIKDAISNLFPEEFNTWKKNNEGLETFSSFLEMIEYKKIDSHDLDSIKNQLENIDDDGSMHEIADSNIDIYNHDLREWAVDNYDYVEQAVDEGLVDTSNFDYHKSIQGGQYVKLNEELWEIHSELLKILD